MPNSTSLINFIKKQLGTRKLAIAIQREPYVHILTEDGVGLQKIAGGAHILLDGILKKTGGLMVAVAAGNADHLVVDGKNRIKVPPKQDKYTLKRIFLTREETEGFYYGFANQTLWPLCHAVFVRPVFNSDWWKSYVEVNKKFADALYDELKGKEAAIWINDYHLALLPLFLKKKTKKFKIGTFWHIPWPTYEIFRICPWRKEIMEGLLGSDFIGFHRGYHVENFIECARRDLGVIVDTEPRSITYNNHTTNVANFPAGIDYHEILEKLERHKGVTKKMIKEDFGFDYEYLAIGVDRIDYTKGIVARVQIIDKFLEKHPKYQGKFVYLSIGAPSRESIPAYHDYNERIAKIIQDVNNKYAKGDWKPIRFINEIVKRDRIFAYYKLADVCMVTSLDDGMNLVAKEFIICNNPKKGMLLLSKFTGAAKDLKSAMLINPYDTEGSADALYLALNMKEDEKEKRNLQMKEIVKENNIYKWGTDFIKETLA
jgi:trehalose 6-phosphate synthase